VNDVTKELMDRVSNMSKGVVVIHVNDEDEMLRKLINGDYDGKFIFNGNND